MQEEMNQKFDAQAEKFAAQADELTKMRQLLTELTGRSATVVDHPPQRSAQTSMSSHSINVGVHGQSPPLCEIHVTRGDSTLPVGRGRVMPCEDEIVSQLYAKVCVDWIDQNYSLEQLPLPAPPGICSLGDVDLGSVILWPVKLVRILTSAPQTRSAPSQSMAPPRNTLPTPPQAVHPPAEVTPHPLQSLIIREALLTDDEIAGLDPAAGRLHDVLMLQPRGIDNIDFELTADVFGAQMEVPLYFDELKDLMLRKSGAER